MKWFECRSVKKAFKWREGEVEKRGKGLRGWERLFEEVAEFLGIGDGELADEIFADIGGWFFVVSGEIFQEFEALSEPLLVGAALGEDDDLMGEKVLMDFA